MKPEEIRGVTLDDIRRYLLGHSWNAVEHPNRLIQVF